MLKISECVCDSARADDQECAQRLRPILDRLAADLAPSTYSAFYDTGMRTFRRLRIAQ